MRQARAYVFLFALFGLLGCVLPHAHAGIGQVVGSIQQFFALPGVAAVATPPTDGQVLTASVSGATTTVAWSTPGAGDITGVTAGTGLDGGGASGAVTLNVEELLADIAAITTGASGQVLMFGGPTGLVNGTPSGGTLAETLVEGNATGGTNILIGDDAIGGNAGQFSASASIGILVAGANGTGADDAKDVSILGGAADSGAAADVNVLAGASSSGTDGSVYLGGNNTSQWRIEPDGDFRYLAGTGVFVTKTIYSPDGTNLGISNLGAADDINISAAEVLNMDGGTSVSIDSAAGNVAITATGGDVVVTGGLTVDGVSVRGDTAWVTSEAVPSGSSFCTWTQNTAVTWTYRVIDGGNTLQVRYRIAMSGAPQAATNLTLALPSAYEPDIQAIALGGSGTLAPLPSQGVAYDADGGPSRRNVVATLDTTNNRIFLQATGSGTWVNVTSTQPFTWANNDLLIVTVEVAILNP